MEENLKKKRKPRYIAVDIWRKEFGPISVAAIFEVFSNKTQIPIGKVKKMNFNTIVDTMRQWEDPEYVRHIDR